MDRKGLPASCGIIVSLFAILTWGCAQQVVKPTSGEWLKPLAEVNLDGVKVRLGKPIQVTEAIGHAWFPTLARFSTGELIVTYALTPDTNQAAMFVSGFQISRDGGKTWGHRYDVIPEFGSTILLPREDGSLIRMPHLLYQISPEDKHNFHGAYTRFERGGRRMIFEPAGVRVVDWPWPVESHPGPIPRTNWNVRLRFDGTIVKIGERLLATAFGRRPGDSLDTSVILASEDGGRTWRYLSTIADPSIMPPSPAKGANGPDEADIIQLVDGDLMAVFRTGSGKQWKLHRAYSSDQGRTWSKAEPLPAYSVEPSLVRTENGTILLSTGRPGIHLWLSTDERARSWEHIDIVEHHNRWAPDATYRIQLAETMDEKRHTTDQTSAYTELVEVTPNRLLLVYDRIAFGWQAVPPESSERSRIFVMPIEVERDK